MSFPGFVWRTSSHDLEHDVPKQVELWLWRAAALGSIFSMTVFMQLKKAILRWEGPLTMISIESPLIHLPSHIVMIGGIVTAFRAPDRAIHDSKSSTLNFPPFLYHLKDGSAASKMRMTAMVITGVPITTSCKPVFSISSLMIPFCVRHSITDPAAPRSVFG